MDDQKPIGAGDPPRAPSARLPSWIILLSASLIAFGVFQQRRLAPNLGNANLAPSGRKQQCPHTQPRPPTVQPVWAAVLLRVWRGISNDRILLVAAGVTFYAILALFPGIGAIVSIYGLFADPNRIIAHLDSLSGFAPGGAVEVLREQLVRLAQQDKAALGFGFAASLLFSLWSANAGVSALFEALTAVYEEKEKRSLIKYYAMTLAFTAGAIILVLLLLTILVALPLVLDRVPNPSSTAALLKVVRWPILLTLVALALAVVYRFGPCRSRPRLRWITWGSAFAAVAWLAASALFSWYVAHFGSYNRTYGSLGAIIGFMTWMWVSIIVVLVGAKFDAAMERQPEFEDAANPSAPRRAKTFGSVQT
jgi:membrane protein